MPIAGTVTAIIPTRGRPSYLRDAIASVLNQTAISVQVLVIIDGPRDIESERVVESFHDPRVNFHALIENHGPAYCRNTGAFLAKTEWIAYLDDDDTWFPDKLHKQMLIAAQHPDKDVVISCRSQIETPSGKYIWPRRLPRRDERVGDYLFCRRSLFKGDSFVQASTILCRRDLIIAYPQRNVAHEDWDWLIRVTEKGKAQFFIAPDTLACHLTEFKRQSLSNMHQFKSSLLWCLSMRSLISREAFAGLLLQTLNGALTERGDWRNGLRIFSMAWRHGNPRFLDTLLFGLQWLFPVSLRRYIRSLFLSSPQRKGVPQV